MTTTEAPLDIEGMRAMTAVLLAEDAEAPACAELESLTLLYRGNLMLLIPAVENAACGLPKDNRPKVCALAGVTEARTRLNQIPGLGTPAGIAHAQRLARSVVCLLTHLESLAREGGAQ